MNKERKNRVIKVIQWDRTGHPTVVTAKAKLQSVVPSAWCPSRPP